jgi:hypothetical protein
MLYWAFTGDDTLVEFNPHLRERGIQIPNPMGGGTVVFNHCPWCGVKLLSSLREVYYDELRAMSASGEDLPEWEDRPPEYTTSQWWRVRGL